ncbi:pentapeptide repeat-containing protein [Granulicella arctica]|uniref:Uncharacterized protein YjbI with pentapeptide repeats n=1 Tax=Granulicella arctica TaxID=940613 RepID=A0A7Y9PEC5_9BACT|nr:pentapeptide repeat-containing protein [Granulicella arctica]NYF78134.1 uncharacterized protein YjbI with pentapeptide repeats [Granulicella arctica]
MAEKPRKPERLRDHPRQLPSASDAHHATKDTILDGIFLEESTASDLDLSGSRLASLRGSNVLFERVTLANSEIGSVRLSDARFVGCDLSNSMLRSFEATRVEFIDCKLVGMNAFASRWQDVLIDHCDARFAQLSEARMRHCEIRSSQFREAALGRATFEATRFLDVVLRQADLAEAKLAGIDLRTSDIEGISLRVEDLRGAIVNPAQAMDLARFLEVVIR